MASMSLMVMSLQIELLSTMGSLHICLNISWPHPGLSNGSGDQILPGHYGTDGLGISKKPQIAVYVILPGGRRRLGHPEIR